MAEMGRIVPMALAAIALFAASECSRADTRAVPVYLVVNQSIGVGADGKKIAVVDPVHGPSMFTGIGALVANAVGAIANNSVNKRTAGHVVRYREAIGTVDFVDEASRAFGCVGAVDCSGLVALTDQTAFEQAVEHDPEHKGMVIELTPGLVPAQFMMRAVAREFVVVEGKIQPRRTLTAIYTERAANSVNTWADKQPAGLEQFWTQGEPRPVVTATRRAFHELSRMLTMLSQNLGPTGTWPAQWSSLPKVKAFEKAGRLKCSGYDWCRVTYVLEDAGDHFLLVEKNNSAMGWYDVAAAKTESNLPGLVMLGLPGK